MLSCRVRPVCLLVVLVLATLPLQAQLSGAVFTTDSTGTLVNGNIYDAKTDVYLNGGPQPNAPCTAAGLPDGDYYFQVTDPSGNTLLSTDALSERVFTVDGGVIVSYGGSTHAIGTGTCAGAISVGLAPFLDTPNPGGEYKVWVTPVAAYNLAAPANSFGFVPADSKTDNFKVRSSPTQAGIWGLKWYDADLDGVQDASEVVIPGWRIEKRPPSTPDVDFTDTSGQYSFLVAPSSGTYQIREVLPNASWLATTPLLGYVSAPASGLVHGPDFGNVCLGAGGGHTLGFWSNKNGAALFGGPDLVEMQNLNLRNADGSHFNPASYSAFRTWLLSATSTNMAYMLSAQLAAMKLNVLNGLVDGTSLIYAPGTASANGLGFATVNAIIAEANTSLGLYGLTLAGHAQRLQQERLKNALDRANNNLNFLQSSPCPFNTPYGPN